MQVEAKTGEKFPAMISAIGKKLNRVTNICKKNLLNHSIFIYRGIKTKTQDYWLLQRCTVVKSQGMWSILIFR